ncbi:MAG TPA: XdhC family protein [Steroidobacteraceae bacterium]|nr:XdhC family protein [Steroidobacteraceae bacterium]
MKAELFAALVAARTTQQSAAIVTRLADGAQALVDATTAQGPLPLPAAAVAEIRRRFVSDESGPLVGDEGLFVRIYAPAPRLLIIGAVHVAQHLAPIAALAGYQVTIIDPRQAFATPQRFQEVTLSHEWPAAAMARLAPDARTAVVTLAHDPKLDDPALVAALRSPAFYVGALGSTRTHAKRAARLEAAGLKAELGRLHAPIGLDLGGRSAAEIAVAIIAEIIAVRHRGARGEMRDGAAVS